MQVFFGFEIKNQQMKFHPELVGNREALHQRPGHRNSSTKQAMKPRKKLDNGQLKTA